MHRSEDYMAAKMERREGNTKYFACWHARSFDLHLVILEVYFLIKGASVHHTKSWTGGIGHYSRCFLHASEI